MLPISTIERIISRRVRQVLRIVDGVDLEVFDRHND